MRHILDSNSGYIPQADFISACREAIASLITAAQSNLSTTLHIPKTVSQYRQLPNGHWHPTCELFIQIRGSCQFDFLHETILIKPGQALLIPPGMAHAETVLRNNDHWSNLVFMFNGNRLIAHNALATSDNKPRGHSVSSFTTPLVQRLQEWVNAIVYANTHQALDLSHHLCFAFLQGIAHVINGTAEADHGQAGFRISQCRLLIHQQLTNCDLSVRALAQQLDCAADYLSHAFHHQVGETLIHYLNRKRIEYACELLRHPHLNISEIARAVGYTDPGYFSRQFKKHRNMSPRIYRQNLDALHLDTLE